VPGHNREMTKDRDGMTQDYLWGPTARTYIRRMPFRDADRLRSGNSGEEFRIIGVDPAQHNPFDVPHNIRLVSDMEFGRITREAARIARRQGLAADVPRK